MNLLLVGEECAALGEMLLELGHSLSTVPGDETQLLAALRISHHVVFVSHHETARLVLAQPVRPALVCITDKPLPHPADAVLSRPITPPKLVEVLQSLGEMPQIEGLDVQAGLARSGGNRALYLKLLRQFLDHEATPQKIAESADPLEAQRLAHSLKGVAGNLGAGAVQSAAARLEKALREQADRQAPLTELQSTLADFTWRLRAALPPETQAPTQPLEKLDPQIVAEMDAHLSCFDVAATELFEARRGLFRALFQTDEFSRFEEQLSHFALPEARHTLRQAAAEKGIPL